MGIGRSSWKKAKEKAKAAGKKIRKKGEGPSPQPSPVNGNAFTGAMAKTGGNYAEAKKLLADSPANYGTGSPFKLMRSKIFKK